MFIHVPKAAGTSVNLALYGRHMGHISAAEFARWAPEDVKCLPRFAVVRNPWDRLLSAYRFVRRGRGEGGAYQGAAYKPEQYRISECETFERFVLEWLSVRQIDDLAPVFRPQWRYVCDRDGRLLVDDLGRFERLDEFFAEVAPQVRLTRANTAGPKVDYRDFYTPEMIDLVGRIYAEDVRRFGYTFGN